MGADMLIQWAETFLQIIVIVGRQRLRMRVQPKCTQGPGEPRHLQIELLRMAALGNTEVPQNGETLVDGMHKPETRDFFRRVSCAALRGSSTSPRKRRTLFIEDIHQRSCDDQQSLTRADLQARRDETRIEDETPRAVAEHSRDRQRD